MAVWVELSAVELTALRDLWIGRLAVAEFNGERLWITFTKMKRDMYISMIERLENGKG
jgi:hypothetical protein